MKRIRKSGATPILSWIVTVALLTPVICSMITPRTAQAQQQGAATQGATTVVVIDFVNKTGILGDTLARLATDDVAVELGNSERWVILTREEVNRQANQLGLRPPYDQVALDKLTSALGATAYVTGEISFAKVDAKANPKTVNVGLKVAIHEASSGELIGGAAVVESAKARPGQSDTDSLAQEAVGNAAVVAVKQINTNILPEGIVLTTVGTTSGLQVLVNRGSRDGVIEGMDMLVLRDRKRVARVRITSVFPTDSEARVIDNILGIRPEDHVRAVFPMPDFDYHGNVVKTAKVARPNSFSVLGKVLVVLLVGLAIIAAASGKKTSVTGVVAEADIQNSAPAVRIVWRDNIFGNGQTLEYHVWRLPDEGFSFQGLPISSVGGSQHQYYDFPAPFSWWDGVRSFLQPSLLQGGGNGGNNQITVVTPAAGSVLGFATGTTLSYQVTGVIRRLLGSGGQNNGGTGGGAGNENFLDVETDPVQSGPTTPINPPLLSTPSDVATNQRLNALNFTFGSQQGADVFQIEISTDRTFKDRSRILVLPLIFSTAPGSTGVSQTLPSAVDITNSPELKRDPTFANFVNRVPGAARPTLFWRVGGRNDNDRPGPVHWITRDPHDNDRTFRFIYSSVRSFQPADLPPPPP